MGAAAQYQNLIKPNELSEKPEKERQTPKTPGLGRRRAAPVAPSASATSRPRPGRARPTSRSRDGPDPRRPGSARTESNRPLRRRLAAAPACVAPQSRSSELENPWADRRDNTHSPENVQTVCSLGLNNSRR